MTDFDRSIKIVKIIVSRNGKVQMSENSYVGVPTLLILTIILLLHKTKTNLTINLDLWSIAMLSRDFVCTP